MTDKVSSKQTRENNEEEETLCVHTNIYIVHRKCKQSPKNNLVKSRCIDAHQNASITHRCDSETCMDPRKNRPIRTIG